ncbi:MAG: PH domain-containing protein [Bryobacteraceae bacterium]|nr:PH domain-containing protein [Bryobacteraceae bacterium]
MKRIRQAAEISIWVAIALLAVFAARDVMEAKEPLADPGLFGSWDFALRCAIAGAGLLVGRHWMHRNHWGEHRIFDAPGEWRALRDEELATWRAEIRLSEPDRAWMMVAVWLAVVVWWTPAHWIAGDPYVVGDLLIETLGGLASAGLAAYAIATKTRYVTAGPQGVAYGSALGSKRVPWSEIHEVKRLDVRKEVEQTNARRGVGRLGRTVVHQLFSRDGRPLFSIDEDLVPAPATRALIAQLKERAGAAAKAG